MIRRQAIPTLSSLFLLLSFTFSEAEIQTEIFVPDADFPVSIAFTPDGRMLYTEKNTGNVRVVEKGALRPDPFLTVTVDNLLERGLLGITVDPQFEDQPFIYVFYTTPQPTINRVERYRDENGFGIDPRIIWEVPDDSPFSGYHHGGNIRFGPDGMLYVTIGDGGTTSMNSQNRGNPLGKIHRINPDGSIPTDNPLYDDGDPNTGNDDRIFAYGLRNSFDFTFHPVTGSLLASENGPDVDDEVNLIIAGGNYGWPMVTGFSNEPMFINPLIAYTPPIAPTGIIIYKDSGSLPNFRNKIVLADYNDGKVRLLHLQKPDYDTVTGEVTVADLPDYGLNGAAQGPDGSIYLTAANAIYRLFSLPDTSRAVVNLMGNMAGIDLSAVSEGDTLATFFFRSENLDSLRVERIRSAEPPGWSGDEDYLARYFVFHPFPPDEAHSVNITVRYSQEEVELSGILHESILKLIRFDGFSWLGEGGNPDTVLNRITLENVQDLKGIWSLSTLDDFPTEIKDVAGAHLSRDFSLFQNHPNPFNPSTTISFEIPEGPPRHVKLEIFDIHGRLVRTLFTDKCRGGGRYEIRWDGRSDRGCSLPSGVYLYRLVAGTSVALRKLTLLK